MTTRQQAASSPQRPTTSAGVVSGALSSSPATVDVNNQAQVVIENTTGIVQIGTGPGGAILDQHQAIVSSTFANLELTQTKATLQQYVDLYEAARKENARLACEVQDRDKDALEVVEFLRFDIEEKNTNLRSAEQKLARVQEEMRLHHEVEIEKWKTLVEQKEETIQSNKEAISSLHKELEAVALFKREKQELFLEVAKYKEQHASTVNRYEKELTKLRFQALEDKVLLRAAEKEMVAKYNEEVDARAMLLVNTKARDIHRENQQLQKDQRSLTIEVGRVTSENEVMKVEVHEVRREAQLGRELQKEYARQGVKLGSHTKDATTKAKHLEDKLSTVVTAYEDKLADSGRNSQYHVQDLQQRLHSSECAEKVLRAELMKMRRLSHKIVSERSELEVFFQEALDYVKMQEQKGGAGRGMPQHTTTTTSWTAASKSRSPRSANPIHTHSAHGLGLSKIPRLPSVEAHLPPPLLATGDNHLKQAQPSSARSARIIGSATRSIVSGGGGGGGREPKSVLTARSVKRDNKMILASVSRENRATAAVVVPPCTTGDNNTGSCSPNITPPSPGGSEHAGRGELVVSREGGDWRRQPPPPPHAAGATSTAMDPEDAVPDFRATPTTNNNNRRDGQERKGKEEGAGGLQFSGLSWTDKETVIRALLFKINQSFYQPPQRQQHPQHPQRTPGSQHRHHPQQEVQEEEGGDTESLAEENQQQSRRRGNGVETFLTDDPTEGIYDEAEVIDEPLHPHGGGGGPRPGTSDSTFGHQGPYRAVSGGGRGSAIPSSAGSLGGDGRRGASSNRPQTRGTLVAATTSGMNSVGTTPIKKAVLPGPAAGVGGLRPGLPPHPPNAPLTKGGVGGTGASSHQKHPPSGSVKLMDGLAAINQLQEPTTDPSVE